LSRAYERNIEAGETARFCLRGQRGHALVCLDDRLLILKRGFHAGSAFGAIASTMFYRDVTGIQVRMHLVSGWIEICSPSFQGSDRKRGGRTNGANADVFKQPNCVPIWRRDVRVYQAALTELRRLVADAKVEHDHGGVVDQLERLAALFHRGLLDEAEFSAAKSRLAASASDVVWREAG
jgi:hypothetical protein